MTDEIELCSLAGFSWFLTLNLGTHPHMQIPQKFRGFFLKIYKSLLLLSPLAFVYVYVYATFKDLNLCKNFFLKYIMIKNICECVCIFCCHNCHPSSHPQKESFGSIDPFMERAVPHRCPLDMHLSPHGRFTKSRKPMHDVSIHVTLLTVDNRTIFNWLLI